MKSSLYTILATLAIGAVGCGGSSTTTTKKSTDMAVASKGDMAVATSNCDAIPDFPPTLDNQPAIGAFYETDSSVIGMDADFGDLIQGFRLNDNDDSTYDLMVIFALHAKGSPAFAPPVTHTFTSTSDFFAGTDGIGLQYVAGVTFNSDKTLNENNATSYAAQSGTLTFSKIDSAIGGTFAVSGANLGLVEWDGSTDKAVANGSCISLTGFTWSATLSADNGGGDAGN